MPAESYRQDEPELSTTLKELLSDSAVSTRSIAAQGLWVRMLSLMYDGRRCGHLEYPNGAPVTVAELGRVSGGLTKRSCQKLIDELERSGVFLRDPDGVIYCPRIVREEEDKRAKRERSAKAGKASAEARTKRDDNADPTEGQRTPQQEVNGPPNGPPNTTSTDTPTDHPTERQQKPNRKPAKPRAAKVETPEIVAEVAAACPVEVAELFENSCAESETIAPPVAQKPVALTAAESPHKRAIDIFETAWSESRNGEKYAFVGGRDALAVKSILHHLDGDLERFRQVVRRYFDDTGFPVQRGHSVHWLSSELNKYIADPPPAPRPVIPINQLPRGRAESDDLLRTMFSDIEGGFDGLPEDVRRRQRPIALPDRR